MGSCLQTHDDDADDKIEVPPELLEELLIYGYLRDIQIDFDSVSRDVIDLCTKWFNAYLKSAQFVFDSFGVDASRTFLQTTKPQNLQKPWPVIF